MLSQFEIRTDDMPTDMQALLNEYPRDRWEAHPGFADKTRQWLRAHLRHGTFSYQLEPILERHGIPYRYAVTSPSSSGVQAAVAAGMPVVGLVAGGDATPSLAERLRAAGADHVVASVDEILPS